MKNWHVHYHVYKSLPLVPFLNQMNSVYTIPPKTVRFILILSPHLCLCLPSVLLPSAFPTKTLYVFLFSPYVLHSWPVSFFLMLFWWRVKVWMSSFSFIQSTTTNCLLGPYSFLSILFWNSLSLCSSVHRREELLQNYFESGCCAWKAEWYASTGISCILLPVCSM